MQIECIELEVHLLVENGLYAERTVLIGGVRRGETGGGDHSR